jgi:elongation factor P
MQLLEAAANPRASELSRRTETTPMASIPAGEFKKGIKVAIDNEPYEMIECHFVKPGKGQALYRTKFRNLLKGTLFEKTYRSGDSLEAADVHKNDGVYSFRDGDSYVFMDNSTFEQHSLPAATVQDDMRWLQEGATVGLLFWNGQLIQMSPPQQVLLKVTYTEPAVRGNTATNVTKPATVETGAEIQVPAFIKEGDTVKIDTESGLYMERVQI